MSLAQETAPKGITVNSVAPGYVATEMVAAVPKEALDKVIAKIPSVVSARPTRSPASWSSWPTPTPASSPDRSTRSTAGGNTCEVGGLHTTETRRPRPHHVVPRIRSALLYVQEAPVTSTAVASPAAASTGGTGVWPSTSCGKDSFGCRACLVVTGGAERGTEELL
jgi:Enoyl-(Acyl carrier protein) reductase